MSQMNTTTQMTEAQRTALAMMDEQNLGAVLTRLGWTWPQHIRDSADAGAAVVEALTH